LIGVIEIVEEDGETARDSGKGIVCRLPVDKGLIGVTGIVGEDGETAKGLGEGITCRVVLYFCCLRISDRNTELITIHE